MEDLELRELEFGLAEEFLLELKKEFDRGDEESVKLMNRNRIKNAIVTTIISFTYFSLIFYNFIFYISITFQSVLLFKSKDRKCYPFSHLDFF